MRTQSETKPTMSQHELATLGLEFIAYMKPVVVEGQPLVAIHSANGEMVGLVPSREAATLAIRENELEPVSVH